MGVATRVSPPPDGLATGGFGLKPAVSEALDRTVAEDATRAAVGLGHAEVLEKVDEAVLDEEAGELGKPFTQPAGFGEPLEPREEWEDWVDWGVAM